MKNLRLKFMVCVSIGLAVTLIVSGLTRLRADPSDNRPPNILLIVSDDQGYRDLGVLRADLITPHLDRLAREGVRLTNFYMAWPACTPSRGAFLTGRYPQRNGTYDMFRNEAPDYGYLYSPEEYAVTFERIGGMDTREILIPRLLAEKGYRCALFGKWDLGSLQRYLPLARGFHEFYGFVNTGIDYFTHERYGVPSMYRNNVPTTEDAGIYITDLIRREALKFIEANYHHQFFLYLAFNAPHNASNLDPRIRSAPQATEKYKRMYPQLREGYVRAPNHPYWQNAEVPTRQTRDLLYRASITAMDDAIGAVLTKLDELRLTDNTFVLFFSDNGGAGVADNSPLRGQKGQLFEGGIRVCALARFPGKIPAGTICDEFLSGVEVFPTFAQLARASFPPDLKLDGFDMLPILEGRQRSPRQTMFWQRREWKAARVETWKWIENRNGEFLFDLAHDVGESTNLIDQQPAKAQELRQAFQEWSREMEAAEPRGPFRDY
ncbi:MAG: sulfatase-like hydrolase/transferase [Thermogutta sp.]